MIILGILPSYLQLYLILFHKYHFTYVSIYLLIIYIYIYIYIYWEREKDIQINKSNVLYSHLLPIMKTIQVRWTRHAGHCRRSKDELISDVLLWIPAYGQAKAGRPVQTYIQQLCENTGCNSEDLPKAMNDREKWRERVRDIRAGGITWWWWWWWYIYEVHTISFLTFFIWALLLIVHTWNSSPLQSDLLRLQCTCCTVPKTSGRPHGCHLVWVCQWPSSQPLSSPQFSHNDSFWA